MEDHNGEEQYGPNRPPDDKFRQQKLTAWQPIMTPLKIICIFVIVGIIFIPVGIALMNASDAIYEDTIIYDGDTSSSVDCSITNQNQGRTCTLKFNITEDVTGPINVYYQLENYYQNHRRYVASRDVDQLTGGTGQSKDELKTTCSASYSNGSKTLNPCGLIANSYFTDVITFDNYTSSPPGLTMDEDDIAWDSDDDKFKQPDGFQSEYVPNDNTPCGAVECANDPAGCQFYEDPDSNTGSGWNYCYPNSDTTQYLYQTYPGLISPIDGVTDNHFKVWMRVAALAKFRKLFGKIHSDFKTGDVLTFNLVANYEVGSFDGTKGMVISSTSSLGGKNQYLGVAYVIVGVISILFALLFVVKQVFAPRPMADASLLNWNIVVEG